MNEIRPLAYVNEYGALEPTLSGVFDLRKGSQLYALGTDVTTIMVRDVKGNWSEFRVVKKDE